MLKASNSHSNKSLFIRLKGYRFIFIILPAKLCGYSCSTPRTIWH